MPKFVLLDNSLALAGGLKGGRGAVAQFMNAAMDICIVSLVKVLESIEDGAGLLGGGSIVEINQRMAMNLLIEDGEVFPQRRPVDCHFTPPLIQSQLQLRRLAQHALVPRRVPDQFHRHIIHRFQREQFILHVLLEHRSGNPIELFEPGERANA